jgi:hypothetical protein
MLPELTVLQVLDFECAWGRKGIEDEWWERKEGGDNQIGSSGCLYYLKEVEVHNCTRLSHLITEVKWTLAQ